MFLNHFQPGRKKRQVDESIVNFNLPEEFTIEELGLNFTEEQRQICSNDLQCLFDLLFTGNEEIALNTLRQNQKVEEQAKLLSKQNSWQVCS